MAELLMTLNIFLSRYQNVFLYTFANWVRVASRGPYLIFDSFHQLVLCKIRLMVCAALVS